MTIENGIATVQKTAPYLCTPTNITLSPKKSLDYRLNLWYNDYSGLGNHPRIPGKRIWKGGTYGGNGNDGFAV